MTYLLRRTRLAVRCEQAHVLAAIGLVRVRDKHEHVFRHIEHGTEQPHLIVLGLFDFKAMLFTHRLEDVERYFSYVDSTHSLPVTVKEMVSNALGNAVGV